MTEAHTPSPTYHEGSRSWLADQLLEPTKLVFALVIAESLRDYRVVLTSPIHSEHYIAALALGGVYLTTVWSWFGGHAAHVDYPYRVSPTDPKGLEKFRFYSDLAIVIAYAYGLFQVEPLVARPRADIVWLLVAYPIIIFLYGVENRLRRHAYGPHVRRTVPLSVAFVAFVVLTVAYAFSRRHLHPSSAGSSELLWLNGVTLVLCMVVMWCYRQFNDFYKRRIDRAIVSARS
jgi:hypothetical protein